MQHRSEIVVKPNLMVIPGGIASVDQSLVNELKPDVIFHFARPVFPRLRKYGRMIAAYRAAYLNRHLIRELSRLETPVPLVFASGSLMYGPSSDPLEEDAHLNPYSFARRYYRGEMPVVEAVRSGNMPVKIVRFPWLLGKGSWFEWFYLRTILNDHSVPQFGVGENLMDIIDVRDAVEIAIHFSILTGGPAVLNIGSGRPITQLEFATEVSRVFEAPVKDHRSVPGMRLEKEALEAFTANIVLATKYKELTGHFRLRPLTETLAGIREELGNI